MAPPMAPPNGTSTPMAPQWHLDVEEGEAEWLIETLETLFDFAFIQPERLKRQKAALNAKLHEAGKPPMK